MHGEWAGLAMSTMDIIRLKGGSPANFFLDVVEVVLTAQVKRLSSFSMILASKKAIFGQYLWW
jgi:succinyl-CoA synthetase beta subunit